MVLILVAGILGGVAVLLALGLWNEAAVRRDWDFVLTAAGSRAHADAAARYEALSRLREMTWRSAAEAAGDRRREFLDLGVRFIEEQGHDLATKLRGIAVLSRMAAAIAPVRPVRPGAFRLGQLRGLAGLGAILHHLLVTTGERLRLRAYVLRAGCGIVARAARGAARRERPEGLAVAGQDLTAISLETLETFHALLLSMEAEPRGGPVWVVDDWR
jgi:hypothetical protein